ncbi:MAG: hypothetical protein LBG52_04955 [Candidatus Peribacteria bacterium]|jgi:hypothetical protein|nr:hypothetical protein [Candidatus Peribacteria bacterium]
MSIELPSETASETAPQSEIFLDKSLETPVEETPIGETPAEENPSLIADDFSLNL